MNLFIMLSFMLSSLIMYISLILGKTSSFSFMKSTPFECGFNPFNETRSPFSLRFFLVALIFLIFDIEISYLIPMVQFYSFSWNIMISTLIIFLVITYSLYHEWYYGNLDWKI